MSGTRRRHQGPRRDRYRPDPRRTPKRPPRPAARLTGGPLDRLTFRIDRADADRGVLHVEGHHGRYVRIDTDEWAWERDHSARSR